MRFTEKVVLVTGAAAGIGKATAQRLAAEGATLVLGDVNAGGLAETARQLGGSPTCIPFDAGDAASCRDFVARAAATAGRIDMLCNIAGIMDWGPLIQFDETRWDRLVQINLSSVFHLSRAAMPYLIRTKGNIVNMSSAAGLIGIAYTAAYCAAKHGVIGLTKSMAIEFASAGVRVNAICPTGVKTAMTSELAWPEGMEMGLIARNAPKMGDMIDPEDVAAAVCYLGSGDARSITGAALPVDSAQTAG